MVWYALVVVARIRQRIVFVALRNFKVKLLVQVIHFQPA